MSTPIKPLAELTSEAIRVLTREMGPADTIRFINQFMPGTGNYTEERDSLIGELTLEEICARGRALNLSEVPDQT